MKSAVSALLVALAVLQGAAPVYDTELLRWSEALMQWRRHADSGALQLSRAVLFDCVAHRRALDVLFPAGHGVDGVAGESSCRYINLMWPPRMRPPNTSPCTEAAEKSAAEAVKLDPGLLEARLRLATLRSEKGEPVTDLAAIVDRADSPPAFRYIAAIFAGKAAYARRDVDGAADWFRKAASVEPRWTVPQLLIAATSSHAIESVPRTDDADPWYRYRCSVLTPAVSEQLSIWIARADR